MGLARVTGGVLALLLVLSGGARPLAAQDAEDATVDRIVAVVGNAVILQSQVEEELFARQSQSRNPVTDPAAIAVLRRQLIDTLIDTELLFQEAIKDTTIQITPQEVSEAVDQVMRDSRRSFKSEAEFLAELKQAGFRGTDDWRRWLIEQQRRTLVIERFRNNLRNDRKLEPKNPTDKELEQFYQDIADRLPPEPAMIAMKQIIVAPQPDSASKARRRKVADSIVVELRKGADFATAARRFSQDPVSAAQGGDLGWFRQGVMVREFERAAFSLPRGTISDPVESPDPTPAIVRILRGDRRALLRTADALAGTDDVMRRPWLAAITGLAEAMIGRAIDRGVLEFPVGNPFWDSFTTGQCRAIASALAAAGFRFDAVNGWSDERVPSYRDLTAAVALAGLEPRRIRAWPTREEIAVLYAEVTVAADELLLDEAPELELADVQEVAGPRAVALVDLWRHWELARPVLAAPVA